MKKVDSEKRRKSRADDQSLQKLNNLSLNMCIIPSHNYKDILLSTYTGLVENAQF